MPLMLNLQRAIRYSFSDGTPWRSGCVALVVGTILNLINQGDLIFGAVPIIERHPLCFRCATMWALDNRIQHHAVAVRTG
jgi:hypothetical protein